MLIPGAMITLDNSIKSGVEPQLPEQVLGEIDVEILFKWMDWDVPELQSRRDSVDRHELLIPDAVPVDYILNI